MPAGEARQEPRGTFLPRAESAVGRGLIVENSTLSTVIRRWCREFGGLKTEHVKRLKDLGLENSQVRKAASDLTVDKLILQEGAPGKLLSPARRRAYMEQGRGQQPVLSSLLGNMRLSAAR